MELRSYIGRRIILLIPTILGAVLLIFLLLQFMSPIQRASLYIQSPKEAMAITEIITKYHLDDPIHVQFYYWVVKLLHGNLGWSETGMMPVSDAFFNFLPATLELFIFAAPIIIWASIKMGVNSAVNRDKVRDHATRIASIVGYAIPNFWLGLLLLMIFYGFFTGLFPPGRLSPAIDSYVHSGAFAQYTRINTIDAILNLDFRVLIDALRHLVLPVTTLVMSSWALLTRITRSSMLESLNRGYVTTARAKGLDEKTVINKHARRNALTSVLTVSGYLVMGLITGAFITETIFGFKGIGWFFVRSATQYDVPVIIGFTLIFAIAIVIINLIVDLLYAYFDPRVRLG